MVFGHACYWYASQPHATDATQHIFAREMQVTHGCNIKRVLYLGSVGTRHALVQEENESLSVLAKS